MNEYIQEKMKEFINNVDIYEWTKWDNYKKYEKLLHQSLQDSYNRGVEDSLLQIKEMEVKTFHEPNSITQFIKKWDMIDNITKLLTNK